MVIFDGAAVSDVVFIVEGTANIGAYFDNLKTAYILPTLEYVIVIVLINICCCYCSHVAQYACGSISMMDNAHTSNAQ